MNWFLIALGAPFLWALVNIADTYLVANFSHRDRERSSGGLVLFSSLIGLVIALGIFIFVPNLFGISFLDKTLLLITGVITILWVILYLFALEIEEVSNIVPWFLTIPVFGYILGYFFLGENLTKEQIIGAVIVLFGLAILSVSWHEEKKRIKHKPVIYMFVACLLVAFSGVLFKYVTVGGDFWVSSFWEYLGLGLSGLLIYIFIPKYRNEFHFMHKTGGKKIFGVNVLSEFMTVAGNLLTNFALLLAPVAMVYMVSSFQPAIVLGLTILGTKFLPHIVKENISFKALFPKILGILIMIFGSLLLFL